MRKLSVQCSKPPQNLNTRAHYKRTKTRASSLKHRVKRFVSILHRKRSQETELEYYPSEILEKNLSYASFHSALVDVNYNPNIEKADKEVMTEILTGDIGIQVHCDVNPDVILLSIPYEMRIFFSMIRSYLPLNTDYEAQCFNKKVLELWDSEEEFREGLKILHTFSSIDGSDHDNISLDNYENYVKALQSLQGIQAICFPFDHPMLKKMDEVIKDRLAKFHSRKIGSELFCKVYYPVKREAPKLLMK